jgi:serine phosphatase RsbU (regulator of sigma subunit)/anti-sigma regulatory factor (Ser/Thr protein kinase)
MIAWRLNEDALEQQRQAEDRLRLETQVVETLHDVGRTLAAELDLHTVIQRVTDAGTDLTPAQFGAFFYNEVNESGEAYQLYTLSGVPAEAFANFPMPRATAVFGPTFAGEGVVRLDDVTQDARFGKSAPYFGMPEGHLPVRSYLAVPVRSRDGEVLGGLFFGHADVGRFTEVDERIIVGIAAHATVAIDNARLYDSERLARAAAEAAGRRLVTLAKAGQVLAASFDVKQTLADLARLVTPELADSCVVYLVNDDGRLEQAVAYADYSLDGVASFGDETIDLRHQTHPVARVVRTGRAEFIALIDPDLIDRAVDDAGHRELVHRIDPTSALVVPLKGRHEVIGALALGTIRSSGRLLSLDDLDLADELARRAAVSIEHTRLFEAQRDVAETLQHSLLPNELPTVPGIDTAVRYVPGGPGAEVGGDWYDVMSFIDGTLGLVMGDVVGRGIPAASLMGQIRNALRAYALDERDPSEVLRRLNALVTEMSSSASMATLVYAVFDPESSVLTIANAGHPPPVILRHDGRAEFVEGGLGPPLGAVLEPSFTNVEIDIDPGSTLVLYTDGLVEDRVTPLDEGLELMRSLLVSGPAELEDLCDHVMYGALAGRQAGDDAALVAMRVLPAEQRLRLTLPCRPNVVRALRTSLRRQLRKAGATEQEEFEILVAVGEACANAIQHAGPASPTFDFDALVGRDVRIVVRDRGHWREPQPSNGGRGLTIMEQFMDRLEVNHTAAGTEVVLVRSLDPAASEASA